MCSEFVSRSVASVEDCLDEGEMQEIAQNDAQAECDPWERWVDEAYYWWAYDSGLLGEDDFHDYQENFWDSVDGPEIDGEYLPKLRARIEAERTLA